MSLSILIYVMHLQGVGHVVRASRIAERLAGEGIDVVLVLGGMPLAGFHPTGVETVQLPALRIAGDSYRTLRTADGQPVDAAYRRARFARLERAFAASRPQIVMIEAYPFDRPQMDFELVPFLDAVVAVRPRPLIVSSIRDILQRKDKPQRDARALELLKTYFDHVLVHGDPRFAVLDDSFRHADEIAAIVHYTGMIAAPALPPIAAPRYDVIVSAGGGTTAKHVLTAAIAAKPLTPFANDRWVVTLGHNIPDTTIAAVQAAGAAAQIDVVDFLPELGRHLVSAKLSISQCGYNTAVDLLKAGCPAVLCPYTGANQNEQLRRAELMDGRGLAVLLREDELSPTALAQAVDRAVALPPASLDIDLDGAANTARVLREIADHQPA